MPTKTDIEWADYSSNPLRATFDGHRGWSCVKVSPGCANCYSATLNRRFGTKLTYTRRDNALVHHDLSAKELDHILRFKPKPPYKNGRDRCAVFPFDMTDVFGDWVDDATLDRLFATFACRPDVDFLVLTKRAERMSAYMAGLQAAADAHAPRTKFGSFTPAQVLNLRMFAGSLAPGGVLGRSIPDAWPLPNVWLGVSVEDGQRKARIDQLRETQAAVRFLSCEPLLEDLGELDLSGISWCIVGGESGSNARHCDVDWIRSIVGQCQAAGVACFVKQLGSRPCGDYSPDVVAGTEWRKLITDRKGGDINEWPDDLRVREFPEVQHANP